MVQDVAGSSPVTHPSPGGRCPAAGSPASCVPPQGAGPTPGSSSGTRARPSPRPARAGRGTGPWIRCDRPPVGITLSAHRDRLRLARVLDRLSEGERDLAGLARELGCTDQSHMTRAVRRTAGLPPGRLRTLPASAEADLTLTAP
ncbi:helix-turn-helix domain-containing protein [Streptomyces triticisoli]|uniref:helix-turn-helix domain-containing protein n=1 Tax=Streptomyces triticisoli TaxID=2182797 RepID=UPI0034DD166B